MIAADQVNALFVDARTLFEDAMEQLEAGKVRNAAEKAWGATKRGTDGLILARTGEEPRTSGQTARGLRALQGVDPEAFGPIRARYAIVQAELHGNCFYDGNCEPEEVIAEDIRATIDYINDAEALAQAV